MKKLLIFFVLAFTTLQLPAQNWTTVVIDSAVSVKLPKGYIKKDTSDRSFSLVARSPFGTILVFKTVDNPRIIPDIERDRHLEDYYDEYTKTVGSAAGGSILNERDTLLGDLKVKDFTLKVDSGSGKQFRNFRILHVSGASYAFEFLYADIHAEYSQPERDRFFNSIMIDEELKRQDQYTTKEPPGIDPLIIGGIVLLILIAVTLYVLLKRRKRRRSTQK